MFSWNTIRTVCAVLLLIPIVHLAFLVSREVLASLNASPEAWADEVGAYVAAAQASELPVDPIVVLGGRQVKLWRGLEDLLSPTPVLMRGLGDATVDDIAHYHSELIGYYRPSAVILLPSTSEFRIRDSKSAPELASAIRKLVEYDESFGVPRQYYIFAPLKTPTYQQDYGKIDETTRLLKRWAMDHPQVNIVDANPLLALENGSPNPDFFGLDGINLNEHGYVRLSVLLQNHLATATGAP